MDVCVAATGKKEAMIHLCVKPDEGKFVETKYRCRACSHEWKERVPAPPERSKVEAHDAT